eukprot:3130131-Rhodomonas_salina.1
MSGADIALCCPASLGETAQSSCCYAPSRSLTRHVVHKVSVSLCTGSGLTSRGLLDAVSLRTRYAMPGADVLYRATLQLRHQQGFVSAHLASVPGLSSPSREPCDARY